MPNEEQITINELRKYLRLVKKRYFKAGKLERGRLLDEQVRLISIRQTCRRGVRISRPR